MPTIPEAERLADLYFRIERNKYQNEQDRAFEYSEKAEALAHDLMQPGQECHPWTVENFYQALTEMADASFILVFSSIAAAAYDAQCNDRELNRDALVSLLNAVHAYWLRIAILRADSILYHRADLEE